MMSLEANCYPYHEKKLNLNVCSCFYLFVYYFLCIMFYSFERSNGETESSHVLVRSLFSQCLGLDKAEARSPGIIWVMQMPGTRLPVP